MLSSYVCRMNGISLSSGRQYISKVAAPLISKPNAHSFRLVSLNKTRTGISRRATATRSRTSVPKCPTVITPSMSLKETCSKSVSKIHPPAIRSSSLRETFMTPAEQGGFRFGKGFAVGASAFGLGVLASYGLVFSSDPGVMDKSKMWPEDVSQRIRATYMYFCGSLAITAAEVAGYVYNRVHNYAIIKVFERHPLIWFFSPLVVMLGSLVVAHSLPFQEGFGAKQVAWALFCTATGTFFAPFCFQLGGPLILRAAFCAAGAVVGLSALAVCAPSEKLLKMGGPLAIGFGILFTASLANLFLPPVTVLRYGLFPISLCAGLVLMFSAFLLYDTQKIVHDAERHSDNLNLNDPYDPINASLGIYMSTINILLRFPLLLFETYCTKKN